MSATAIKQATGQHGVAHFLFHQTHLHGKPYVAEEFLKLIARGHDAGLDWWTCAWTTNRERQPRTIRVDVANDRIVIHSDAPVSGATISVVPPKNVVADTVSIHNGATPVHVTTAERWNQPAVTFQMNLTAGKTMLTLEYCRPG